MHAAPPVSVWVRGGVSWRVLRSGLPALAAGAVAAWLAQHLGHWAWALPAGVLAAVAVAVVAWWLERDPTVSLQWDGHQWLADGQAGDLRIAIELPRWLLLRHRARDGGRARWIPMRIADIDPATETLLRVALHAATADDTGARLQPPVA